MQAQGLIWVLLPILVNVGPAAKSMWDQEILSICCPSTKIRLTVPSSWNINFILQVFFMRWGNSRQQGRNYCGSHLTCVLTFLCLTKRIKLNQTNELLLLNEVHSSWVQLEKVQRLLYQRRLNNSGFSPQKRGGQRGIWWRFTNGKWHGEARMEILISASDFRLKRHRLKSARGEFKDNNQLNCSTSFQRNSWQSKL